MNNTSSRMPAWQVVRNFCVLMLYALVIGCALGGMYNVLSHWITIPLWAFYGSLYVTVLSSTRMIQRRMPAAWQVPDWHWRMSKSTAHKLVEYGWVVWLLGALVWALWYYTDLRNLFGM